MKKVCMYDGCEEHATNKYPLRQSDNFSVDFCKMHYDEVYRTHHHPYNPQVVPKLKKELGIKARP